MKRTELKRGSPIQPKRHPRKCRVCGEPYEEYEARLAERKRQHLEKVFGGGGWRYSRHQHETARQSCCPAWT